MDENESRPAAADCYAVYVLDDRSRRVWEHLETFPSRRDAALTAAVVAQHEGVAATRVVAFPAGVPIPRWLDATLGDGAVPAPASDGAAAPASLGDGRRGGWYRASDWR